MSNDTFRDVDDLIKYSLIALAAYVAYQIWKKGSSTGSGILDALTQPIANAYVAATSTTQPTTANMVLSDGTTIPLANATTQWQGNTLLATVNGSTYSLSSANSDGDYPAVQVQ